MPYVSNQHHLQEQDEVEEEEEDASEEEVAKGGEVEASPNPGSQWPMTSQEFNFYNTEEPQWEELTE